MPDYDAVWLRVFGDKEQHVIRDAEFINQILILKWQGKHVIQSAHKGAHRPPRTTLPTDLRVEFNHRACKLLFHDLIEIVFVGVVINELLAFHNLSLEPKEKHVRGR